MLRGATQIRQKTCPFVPRLVGHALRFRQMPYTPAPKMSFPGSFVRGSSQCPALWQQRDSRYCFFILAFQNILSQKERIVNVFAA